MISWQNEILPLCTLRLMNFTSLKNIVKIEFGFCNVKYFFIAISIFNNLSMTFGHSEQIISFECTFESFKCESYTINRRFLCLSLIVIGIQSLHAYNSKHIISFFDLTI